MFRVIDLGDGSSLVCDGQSGQRISVVPSTEPSSLMLLRNLRPKLYNASFTKKSELNDLTNDIVFKFDFSSYLGSILIRAFPRYKRKPSTCPTTPAEYERYCVTPKLPSNQSQQGEANESGKKFNTRSNTFLTDKYTSQGTNKTKQAYCHVYSYTKRDRLERWYFLETGLSTKGRILSFCCQKLSVNVDKMTHCPVCKLVIGSCSYHRCLPSKTYESDVDHCN